MYEQITTKDLLVQANFLEGEGVFLAATAMAVKLAAQRPIICAERI